MSPSIYLCQLFFSIDPLNSIYILYNIEHFVQSSCLTLESLDTIRLRTQSSPLPCPPQHGLWLCAGLYPVPDALTWGVRIFLPSLQYTYAGSNRPYSGNSKLTSSNVFMFWGNPLQEKHAADGDWIQMVSAKNKTIRKLDGKQQRKPKLTHVFAFHAQCIAKYAF